MWATRAFVYYAHLGVASITPITPDDIPRKYVLVPRIVYNVTRRVFPSIFPPGHETNYWAISWLCWVNSLDFGQAYEIVLRRPNMHISQWNIPRHASIQLTFVQKSILLSRNNKEIAQQSPDLFNFPRERVGSGCETTSLAVNHRREGGEPGNEAKNCWDPRERVLRAFVAMIRWGEAFYILERGLVSIGKLTYQTICACSSAHVWNVRVDCVFGKGNRESSNPPTKKQTMHKPLNGLQGLVIKLQLRAN